jgi:ABC-type transport system involved in multi-copper enzyme maturation permease subunit
MYAWKCWRDTRGAFLTYLALLAVIAGTGSIASVFFRGRVKHGDVSLEEMWATCIGLAFATAYLCSIVMALSIGSQNVGLDISRGSADFLLTRPRTRGYFVWTGWIVGLVEVLVLIAISVIAVVGLFAVVIGPVWHRLPSPMYTVVQGHILDVPVLVVVVGLNAIVLYGLTYFMTVAFRNSGRGVVATIFVILGHSLLSASLRNYAGISLPSLTSFTNDARQIVPMYTLATPIIGWVLVALVFPVASQMILEKYDI